MVPIPAPHSVTEDAMEKMVRFEDLFPVERREEAREADRRVIIDLSHERDIDPDFHAMLFQVFARG